jgi:CoA-transferase family III
LTATVAAPTASSPATSGAPAGLRVLEIGALIAGPLAGRLLAGSGADVIKIEAPGAPDPLRGRGQVHHDERGLFWTIHARNKRCITLDLRTEDSKWVVVAANQDSVFRRLWCSHASKPPGPRPVPSILLPKSSGILSSLPARCSRITSTRVSTRVCPVRVSRPGCPGRPIRWVGPSASGQPTAEVYSELLGLGTTAVCELEFKGYI